MRRPRFTTHGYGAALVGAGTCLFGSLSGIASAQQTPSADRASDEPLEEVVVTGIRRSLLESTQAKREATGFTDAIFAEDIGKFPDTNIAESFNRIPGISIQREISGEGLQIAIRGLGTNFTRVLLNGAPVAVASTGRTDAQGANREVDLDLFPTELFTQLTVRKSASASMLEGGAAGTVNMRSARPFDREGQQLTYSFQGTNNSEADSWGGRGSILASKTWDTFGVLIGVAGVQNDTLVRGFEANQYTNPNLSVAQCLANPAPGAVNTCNGNGGNQIAIPGTVPANVAAVTGLTAGAPIDRAFLLAQNPGLTIEQIDNALITRLGRPSNEAGSRDRYNGIVSFELRPSDNLNFYLDGMYGEKKNDLTRIDMNLVGRNGALIPLNMKVDRTDCSRNCVVTEATFANAQFFLEYRPFIEEVDFWGANPGFEWQISDAFRLDLQANKTRSDFSRESPTALFITPQSAQGSNVVVNYKNDGGIPTMTSNIDLNNPANFGWPGGRVNMQDERRRTETEGVRSNFTWERSEAMKLGFGLAYDDVSRRIDALDNSRAWQNAVCGGNPNVFLDAPNGQPGCNGFGSTGNLAYPGYGQGATAGAPPLVYQGSLIPNAAVPAYLYPGPDGYVTLDWERFKADSQYDAFHDATRLGGASNTQARTGFIGEKSAGAYFQLSGEVTVNENSLRYTAGLRRVRTEQTIQGRQEVGDPRNQTNGVAAPDGSRFPANVIFPEQETTYWNTLPAFELAYNLTENTIIRGAASKTMTRPDPGQMLPGIDFSGTAADTANIGNQSLAPYESENVDIGLEVYTGAEGYFGLAAFRKRVTNFTTQQITNVPFTDLAAFGVTFDTLNATQQTAINNRGGPNVARVNLSQTVNAPSALTVNGLEFNWVQPLDALLGRWGLDGLGFSANLTLISQSTPSGSAIPAVALGVAPHTYNTTLYYEKRAISARLSQTFAKGSQQTVFNQQNVPLAAIFGDDYEQWDFSSSFNLSELFNWGENDIQLTLDVQNLFQQKQRAYLQFPNAPQTIYYPGRQYMVGFRGQF